MECVVNVSEGRCEAVIDALRTAAGCSLLDVHTDADHHRTVLTLGGAPDRMEEDVRSLVLAAVERIDLAGHRGVHPRLGAVDVVPFVPLAGGPVDGPEWVGALALRTRFAGWAGSLGIPCFLYGAERSLPAVRRGAFTSVAPDTGPTQAHPTAGAIAVGARPVLVAYNLWLGRTGPEDERDASLTDVAGAVAVAIRSPTVRSLGFPVGDGAQVSCNLLEPTGAALARLYDAVAARAEAAGCAVVRAELVGLIPSATLARIPERRWTELDIDASRTIEARLATSG